MKSYTDIKGFPFLISTVRSQKHAMHFSPFTKLQFPSSKFSSATCKLLTHGQCLICTHTVAHSHTHAGMLQIPSPCKHAPDRVTLTCGSTDAGVASPFCLEKQKEAIGGRRRKGRTAREGGRDGWMDGGGGGGWEGRRGGGNKRAEWF